ncbi:MAG: trypsin-like peptidase domain-containing protein [Clostridia bacterium]|nr:trypsin-like peptidase domain-containing protein [Clostridia bacterium]
MTDLEKTFNDADPFAETPVNVPAEPYAETPVEIIPAAPAETPADIYAGSQVELPPLPEQVRTEPDTQTVAAAVQTFDQAAVTAESVEDYKEHIRQLKREYRKTKKAEKRARQNAAVVKSKPRIGLTVFISILSTLLCMALICALLLYFPTKESSLFATLLKKYNASNTGYSRTQPSGTHVGDDEIAPGSQITINVDGEGNTTVAYAKAVPSVVAIMTVQVSGAAWENPTETGLSQGAGVVVSEDGEILTNFHVIDSIVDRSTGAIGKNYKVYVYFDSSLVEPYEVVSLLGYDEDFDLALIKVDRTGLTPIEFADSDKLSIGEKVIAIGSPGGIEFMNSVCDGVISGLKRSIVSSSSDIVLYDMIQMTAPINPGNSGGAVVNSEGKLVGISVIKVVAENYENMSFAISSNTASRIIDSFRKYGKYVKPVLGVTIDTRYDWKAAKDNNWSQGAYVEDVSAGSSADEAGVKKQDIICAIEGIEVLDFATLRTELLKFAPGDTITLRVYRPSDDKFYDLKVTLKAS